MCSSQVICPCFTTWELLSASCASAFTPPSSRHWPGCASCLDTRGSSTRYAPPPPYFKSSSPSAVSFAGFNSARFQSGSCKHRQRRCGFRSVALVLHSEAADTVLFLQADYVYCLLSAVFEWMLSVNLQLFELSFAAEFCFFSSFMLANIFGKQEDKKPLMLTMSWEEATLGSKRPE